MVIIAPRECVKGGFLEEVVLKPGSLSSRKDWAWGAGSRDEYRMPLGSPDCGVG